MSIIDMILDDDNISKDFKKALKDESNDKVKIKVTCIEWTSKKVERVCEVDKDEYQNNIYGLGYLDGGDLQTDAEGFNADTISKKILDNDYENNKTDIEWEEI